MIYLFKFFKTKNILCRELEGALGKTKSSGQKKKKSVPRASTRTLGKGSFASASTCALVKEFPKEKKLKLANGSGKIPKFVVLQLMLSFDYRKSLEVQT
jgi:hypothetical protein